MRKLPTNMFTVKKPLFYTVLAAIGLIGAICLSQFAEAADKTMSAGLGLSNGACGTGEPTASIAYDRDGDTIPAHFKLGVGPNGSCDGQGVTVDALVEGRYYVREQLFALAGAGYDLRTVPFEYAATSWGTKQFRGERVETVQALFGLGYDGGDWSVQAAYNVVENKLSGGDNLFPVQLNARWNLADLELSGTTNVDTHTMAASYIYRKIELAGSVSFGFHKLDNPAPDYLAGDGLMFLRADAPSPLYNFTIRWVF